MEPYVSFPNDAILSSVIPLRKIPAGPAGDNHFWEFPSSLHQSTIEEAIMEEAAPVRRPQEEPSTPQTPGEEPTMKRKASPTWFPGWREVLHPSWPVIATEQAPAVPQESRQRPHSQSSGGGSTLKGGRASSS